MLFINFNSEIAASFKYKYRELAELYKGDSLSFLMADIHVSSHSIKVHNSVSLCYHCNFEVYLLFVLVSVVWLLPLNKYVQ